MGRYGLYRRQNFKAVIPACTLRLQRGNPVKTVDNPKQKRDRRRKPSNEAQGNASRYTVIVSSLGSILTIISYRYPCPKYGNTDPESNQARDSSLTPSRCLGALITIVAPAAGSLSRLAIFSISNRPKGSRRSVIQRQRINTHRHRPDLYHQHLRGPHMKAREMSSSIFNHTMTCLCITRVHPFRPMQVRKDYDLWQRCLYA